jgi:hypothetical protein
LRISTLDLRRLRRSEFNEVVQQLSDPYAVAELKSKVLRTLESYPIYSQDLAEDIYLFGVTMRRLSDARPEAELFVPGYWKDGLNEEIFLVFSQGYLLETFAEALKSIENRRNQKNAERRAREAVADDLKSDEVGNQFAPLVPGSR